MARKLKTSKSALKRFRFTKSGKVTHRAPNMNHFNAKDTGRERRGKRGERLLAKANYKDIRNLMPYK